MEFDEPVTAATPGQAVAFYEFTRTMQSYEAIIAQNTTLVMSTGSDLFKYLKDMTPDGDVVPVQRAGGEIVRADHSGDKR